jgi:hypothetical protein
MTLAASSYIQNQIEQRERQMQTAFPAKVLSWDSSTNTVQLEPQFFEVWRDGEERRTETIAAPEDAYIDNVPVLFPRSGTWSITFPIEAGSFGLVICTKYSLDVWRNQGNAGDPGDLRRFTMSGAVFHPVNLHPNGSALSNVSSTTMNLAGSDDFIALAAKVDAAFNAMVVATVPALDGGIVLQEALQAAWGDPGAGSTDTCASTKVKAGA